MQASLVFGLLALSGFNSSSQPLPDPAWKLHRIPAEFHRGHAFVTLEVERSGFRRKTRFLLDSGSWASILLPTRVEPKQSTNPDGSWVTESVQLALLSKDGRKGLGSANLAALLDKVFSNELIAYLRSQKAEGLLGVDFFKSRDVYIDYQKQEVWVTDDKVSESDSDPTKLGFRSVNLAPWNGCMAAIVWVKRLGPQIVFPLMDTGAMQTTLPDSMAPNPKPEGAKESRILSPQGFLSGWIHRESVFTFSDNSEHEVPIHYVNTQVPALAPRDLGSQALFQFRLNKAWFK